MNGIGMRPLSVVHGRDKDVIPLLFQVHASAARDILDCTYNRGVMWKGSGWTPTATSDVDPDSEAMTEADCRWLPFDDASFDVVAFDPPHLPDKGISESNYVERYGLGAGGDYRTGDNVVPLFEGFLKEASRVLRPGGVVFAKLVDLVHNHRYQWQHVDFICAAKLAGMTPCDLVIKIDPASANLSSSKWRNIRHFRRGHTYWLVVRNSTRCEGELTAIADDTPPLRLPAISMSPFPPASSPDTDEQLGLW